MIKRASNHKRKIILELQSGLSINTLPCCNTLIWPTRFGSDSWIDVKGQEMFPEAIPSLI